MFVPVAQLDRVLASDAKGRGFESLRVRQIKNPPQPKRRGYFYGYPKGRTQVRSLHLEKLFRKKFSS